MKVIVCVSALLLVGCAARGYQPAAATNLTGYMTGAGLFNQDGCFVLASFENGRSVRASIDEAVCHDAAIAQASKAAAAARVPPAPARPAVAPEPAK